MYNNDPITAQNGPLAIAIPAEVKGLYEAYNRYGSNRISWNDLVMPAADLARQGWVIADDVAAEIKVIEPYIISGEYNELAKQYMKMDGTIKEAGDIVRQPILANTLEEIAKNGPDYIYKTMSEVLANEIQAAGGIITKEDFEEYEPLLHEPIRTTFMGHTYVGASGSSSGGVAVAGILKFMEGYDEPLASLGDLYYHRLAEAYKHIFAMRTHLADPTFHNITDLVDAFLSTSYMDALRDMTNDNIILDIDKYGGFYNYKSNLKDSGTTHLSVIDKDGNAVGN